MANHGEQKKIGTGHGTVADGWYKSPQPPLFFLIVVHCCKFYHPLYQLETITVQLKQEQVQLLAPSLEQVQAAYAVAKLQAAAVPFPYWAKLWPSAVAMCLFLEENLGLIQQQKVLELAAGLGLPSIWAAKYASQVLCTDYLPQALQVVQESIVLNGIKNMGCASMDWHHFPASGFVYDVVLLSDVNYDPQNFEVLHNLLLQLMAHQKTIVLSTPQRLMAKDFIMPLLGHCKQQTTIDVEDTPISIFVL